MSLNWNWKNKCGELVVVQERNGEPHEFTLSLYEGNALLIMLYEYKDKEGTDMYDMFSFFVDKTHAKKCLGLQKNGDGELINLFDEDWQKFTKIRLNKAKSRNFKDIVELFSKAFDNITIEIYTEEEKEDA